MSLENLNRFLQLVKTDEQVAQRAAAIGYRNLTGLIEYGRELQLDFNEQDFKTLQIESIGDPKELSDAELGSVSGGTPNRYS